MTETASGLSQARPAARLFRAWLLLAGALALLPVVRTWQLTGDTDTTVTTLAVFAGAAWQIGALLSSVVDRPSARTRGWAILSLGLGIWQLSWVSVDDFWFLRAALILWAVVWLLLAWGWAGLVFGWRILAAFVLWAAFCDAPWQWVRAGFQTGDSIGPALAEVTARIGGGLLWIFGAPVRIDHNLIEFSGHIVSVGVPCTALPLVKLLLLLLALATLLLRLDWLPVAGLALKTVLISFLISVGRVMLLAYVVRDPSWFHYWHDADGDGGGWFTAAGMLAIAFLITRQIFRQRLGRIPDAPAEVRLPARPIDGRLVALASIAGLTIARLGPIHSSPRLPAPLSSPDFSMVSDATQTIESAAHTAPEPNAPSSVRRVTYAANSGPARLEFVIAQIPRTLTGDPLRHPELNAQIPVTAGWSVPRGGRYAVGRSPQASAWVATVAAGEPPIATAAAWAAHLRGAFTRPGRWLAWLAHREPLRDKRSYWVGACETDGTGAVPEAPPKLFFDWIAVLARSP